MAVVSYGEALPAAFDGQQTALVIAIATVEIIFSAVASAATEVRRCNLRMYTVRTGATNGADTARESSTTSLGELKSSDIVM